MGVESVELGADWSVDHDDLDEEYSGGLRCGLIQSEPSGDPESSVSGGRDADEEQWVGGGEADGYKPNPTDGQLRGDDVQVEQPSPREQPVICINCDGFISSSKEWWT